MDGIDEFYSLTGRWWGRAESGVGDRERRRVALTHRLRGDAPGRVLELGCGYGNTAAAFGEAGHRVVGVELTDRIDHAAAHIDRLGPEALRTIRGDFYTVDLDGRFDVVAYWNGFGVGTDTDQRRLLRRIAEEWLDSAGVALIDVFNPLVWASWDGEEDHLMPSPEHGYEHELMQRLSFDPVSSTAVDTWWDAAEPERRITQRLRCYSPADLRLLLEGTGLALHTVVAGDEPVDLDGDHLGHVGMLREHHEYLAVLKPESPSAGRS